MPQLWSSLVMGPRCQASGPYSRRPWSLTVSLEPDRCPWSVLGGEDVGGLNDAWAGGCCVHGATGSFRAGTGGNHQQRDRFAAAGDGHADGVAGNRGEPVDPDTVAPAAGELARDVVPFVAMDGHPLHPHARKDVQRRDKARQLGKCVAGAWPPSSVDHATLLESGSKADSRR